MSDTTTDTTAAQPSWWEQTIGYVLKSAADSKFKTLQPGVQYQVDANGNVVPMGVVNTPAAQSAAAVQSMAPLVMLAVAAVGLYLVVKMVK